MKSLMLQMELDYFHSKRLFILILQLLHEITACAV